MKRPPAAEEVLGALFPSPRWFPHMVDPPQRIVRMVEFRGADYVKAPFLDHRALNEGMRSLLVPWDDVAAAVPRDAPSRAHMIFQISHVGSTLVSRLLAGLDTILSYREPMLLLALASLDAGRRRERLPTVMRLLSRSFARNQVPVVKANSAVTDMAAAIMRETGGKALFLRMRADRYIASRVAKGFDDLDNRHEHRRARLEARIGQPVDVLPTAAAMAALAWATEAGAMERQASEIDPERLIFEDFDRLLDDMGSRLGALFAHFDQAAGKGQIDRLLAGPLVHANAKRAGQPFDAAARSARIDRSSREHHADIDEALRWLEALGGRDPWVRAALDRG